jgi:hypothetical protein
VPRDWEPLTIFRQQTSSGQFLEDEGVPGKRRIGIWGRGVPAESRPMEKFAPMHVLLPSACQWPPECFPFVDDYCGGAKVYRLSHVRRFEKAVLWAPDELPLAAANNF